MKFLLEKAKNLTNLLGSSPKKIIQKVYIRELSY